MGVLLSSLPSVDYTSTVCPLLITHNTVGVLQSSLPSADYPQYCGGFAYPQYCKAVWPLLITHNTVGTMLWGFYKAVCPLLITHNTVGVLQSSLPSADYPQYCGGFTKQFALC